MQGCTLLFKYGNGFMHLDEVLCTRVADDMYTSVLFLF